MAPLHIQRVSEIMHGSKIVCSSVSLFLPDNWPSIEENLSSYPRQGHFSDITDGLIYRDEVPANPHMNGTCTFSITWHIDGSTAIKSRNVKIWPIFAIIIELPKHLRYSFRNVLFCGLWYGKEKPDFALFQTPFVMDVLSLMNGFVVELPNRHLPCKLRIQGQVADLPAKAASINLKQFNGKFGCSVCLEPGEKDRDNPLLKYYPYKATKAPLPNHEDTMHHAKLADVGSSIFGVKGQSPVHQILKIPEKSFLISCIKL